MAKGKFRGAPGGGMGNINSMMKQVQKMQRDMEKAQAELEEKNYEAQAGGGVVKVVVNGAKVLKEITLAPEVVDPDDIAMLEDLIIVAINDAHKKADDEANKTLGQMTGGVNIPGLF